MEKLLSNKDIEKIVNKKIKFVIYDDLIKMKSWKDLFNGSDLVLLLYSDPNINPKKGHWVGLKKTHNKIIFFDSFGNEPDEILKNITYDYHAELARILVNSPFQIDYNAIRLQNYNSNVCGRYVSLFFKFCDTDIDKFVKVFTDFKNKTGFSPDYLAYVLTSQI